MNEGNHQLSCIVLQLLSFLPFANGIEFLQHTPFECMIRVAMNDVQF